MQRTLIFTNAASLFERMKSSTISISKAFFPGNLIIAPSDVIIFQTGLSAEESNRNLFSVVK